MDTRLKGLALNLDLLRKDLEQRKAARVLPKERSPSSSGFYSPSKTDRGLKRSLSPTLQEVERLRRQAQSPRTRNWQGRPGDEGGKSTAGLSGISLPNTRTELISQYQKTPWELPYQATRPLHTTNRHHQAAEMLGRSLKRHFIAIFKDWKQQVCLVPRRRYASSNRTYTSPPGFSMRGGKRREATVGSPVPKSPAASPSYSEEYQIESSNTRTAPSPRPLELSDLLLEPSAPRHITQVYKSTRFLPNASESPHNPLISSSSARLLPSFTLIAPKPPIHSQPLTRLVSILESAVRDQTGRVLRILGVWAVRSEAVGKLTIWLHRHVIAAYQQGLYALLFVQKKQRSRGSSRAEIRTGRKRLKPEGVKKLIQTCGPIVMAAIITTQRDAFDAILDAADHQYFHRSQYILHIPQLILVLQPLFLQQIQALFPLLRIHIKAKTKWQTRVKLHFRACFRIFSIKRIKVLTRYINRYRAGIAVQRELRRKGRALGEQLWKGVVSVVGKYWIALGRKGREFEKGDSLKVRRLLANVGKSLEFRMSAVFGEWARKSKEKPSQSSFEAKFLSSLFHSLSRASLSPAFALLTQPPRSLHVRSLSLFPLFLLLHIKVKAAQGLAFYHIHAICSMEMSPKLVKTAAKSMFTVLTIWTNRVNSEVWDKMRTFAPIGRAAKREIQLSDAGKRLTSLISGFSRVLRSTQQQALCKWHSQVFSLLEAALVLQSALETCSAAAQLWALSKLTIS